MNAPWITTSWDDGHPLDLRVAEALAKYGLQGTFYVALENSRPTLSPVQIRELSSQFEIGGHTVHHVVLTSVRDDQAQTEIVESKKRVEQITGKPCTTFCFPKGRFASRHLRLVAEAGFSAVRTVELLSLDRPRVHDGLAVIPTTVQAYPHSTGAYLRNAAKRLSGGALWNLMVCNRKNDWAVTAIALLDRVRRIEGVFHLWGHSWEIEEAGQWQALDRVLAALGEACKYASCVTNADLCRNGK
jgi:peptidoglycan/xylan/chitin deacetylase (PgdA/CDA1 family)